MVQSIEKHVSQTCATTTQKCYTASIRWNANLTLESNAEMRAQDLHSIHEADHREIIDLSLDSNIKMGSQISFHIPK